MEFHPVVRWSGGEQVHDPQGARSVVGRDERQSEPTGEQCTGHLGKLSGRQFHHDAAGTLGPEVLEG
jgi:hypothetical protein